LGVPIHANDIGIVRGKIVLHTPRHIKMGFCRQLFQGIVVQMIEMVMGNGNNGYFICTGILRVRG